MIFLGQNLIVQGGKTEVITDYRVVFKTPFGYTENRQEACDYCISKDLDPDTCVVASVKVMSETLSEVL